MASFGAMGNGYDQPQRNNFSYMSQQSSQLQGRFVTSPNDILPREVPINCDCLFFPVSDGSCIYVKSWNANGSISISRYVPEQATSAQNEQPSEFSQVMEELGEIKDLLSRRNNTFYNKKKPYQRNYNDKKPVNEGNNPPINEGGA